MGIRSQLVFQFVEQLFLALWAICYSGRVAKVTAIGLLICAIESCEQTAPAELGDHVSDCLMDIEDMVEQVKRAEGPLCFCSRLATFLFIQ